MLEDSQIIELFLNVQNKQLWSYQKSMVMYAIVFQEIF